MYGTAVDKRPAIVVLDDDRTSRERLERESLRPLRTRLSCGREGFPNGRLPVAALHARRR